MPNCPTAGMARCWNPAARPWLRPSWATQAGPRTPAAWPRRCRSSSFTVPCWCRAQAGWPTGSSAAIPGGSDCSSCLPQHWAASCPGLGWAGRPGPGAGRSQAVGWRTGRRWRSPRCACSASGPASRPRSRPRSTRCRPCCCWDCRRSGGRSSSCPGSRQLAWLWVLGLRFGRGQALAPRHWVVLAGLLGALTAIALLGLLTPTLV